MNVIYFGAWDWLTAITMFNVDVDISTANCFYFSSFAKFRARNSKWNGFQTKITIFKFVGKKCIVSLIVWCYLCVMFKWFFSLVWENRNSQLEMLLYEICSNRQNKNTKMIKLQYRCLDSNSIANHLICDFDRKICCSLKSINWGHSFILKEFRTCFKLTHSNEKIILYLAYVFQIIVVFFFYFIYLFCSFFW